MSKLIISSSGGRGIENEPGFTETSDYLSRTLASIYLDCDVEDLEKIEKEKGLRVFEIDKGYGISESYDISDFPILVEAAASLPDRAENDILKDIDVSGDFEIQYQRSGTVLKFVK